MNFFAKLSYKHKHLLVALFAGVMFGPIEIYQQYQEMDGKIIRMALCTSTWMFWILIDYKLMFIAWLIHICVMSSVILLEVPDMVVAQLINEIEAMFEKSDI